MLHWKKFLNEIGKILWSEKLLIDLRKIPIRRRDKGRGQ